MANEGLAMGRQALRYQAATGTVSYGLWYGLASRLLGGPSGPISMNSQ